MPHCFNKKYLLFIVALCACHFPGLLFSQVQINSVTPSESTCANNGSITVSATSASAVLVYSLTSGPITAPVQTSNIFNSLPPGLYTVTVADGASNTQSQNVTVPGTYLPPDFNPLKRSPYCPGQSNGQLIGNRNFGTGFGPFTWELVAPSPVVAGPQASDTFNNIPAGNYTMRLTDGCGGFRTVVTTLVDPPPANIYFVVPPSVNIVGCDSALLSMNVHADVFRFPLTCTFVTSAGTFTTTANTITDTTNSCCGYFTLQQILPNVTYGGSVQVSIIDACGNTFVSPTYYVKPFRFCTGIAATYTNCVFGEDIYFDENSAGCDFTNAMSTAVKPPLTYEVRDAVTNAVAASGTAQTYNDNFGNTVVSGFSVSGLPPNHQYTITTTDGCGKISTQSYFVNLPIAPTPSVSNKSVYPDGCVDSSAFAFVFVDSFPKQPVLIFLSGPSRMGSTKPGYEYENHYAYPDTFPVLGFGSSTYRFDISNLSVGTYHFKVVDSCGTELFDSLVVTPADVTNFSHEFSYKKGCLGRNEIHYNIFSPNGQMFISNQSGTVGEFRSYQSQDWATPIHDSILNLPSGTYQLFFTHSAYFGTAASAAADPVVCTEIRETIVIDGYQTPAIIANNYIQCRSSTFLELRPDSSKGVPPYQYEIISGPQTFPIQNSNLFTLTTAGTYTVRIYDICGNGSTAQITVSPIAFPPVTTLPFGCNSTNLTYGASSFYTYNWTSPNGSIYTGDTLSINPVTAADTGTYFIEKIVNINGCVDTFRTTHHIGLHNITNQSVSICTGGSVTLGTHTYTTTGIYTDTLLNINMCDSVVVLNLTVTSEKRDTTRQTICEGNSFTFNGNAYTLTGFYSDTLTTGSCDSISTLQLTVNPLKRDTVTASICTGGSYLFNGSNLTTAGIYRDTLTTIGCDSIVVLNLTISSVKRDTTDQHICEGNGFTFNGNVYTQTGFYRDTLTTSSCDSISTLHLIVDPLKRDTIFRNICTGGSFFFGGTNLTTSGIYRDTLATTGCDSIVLLNLTVSSVKRDTTRQNICAGNSFTFNGNVYTLAGSYSDTFTTSSCDSIITLLLTVNPLKRDTVSASICTGQSYFFNDNNLTVAGAYRDTFTTATCDSIVLLNLSVGAVKRDSIVRAACDGQGFLFNGTLLTLPGIYRDTLTTSTCDSIITLNLSFYPQKRDTIVQTICLGQTYTFNGNVLTQTGIYFDTIPTPTCDSLVILSLGVVPVARDTAFQSICEGYTYFENGHAYSVAGAYSDTIPNGACYRIRVLNISVIPRSREVIARTICFGDTAMVNGHVYTQSGTYVDTVVTANCDRIIILNLTVLPIRTIQITATPDSVDAGGTVQLNVTPSSNYLWSSPGGLINNNNIQNPVATLNAPSWIYVTANAFGFCESKDSIFIRVTYVPPCLGSYIYMPNAFTPNGDPHNNEFKVLSEKNTLNYFVIFNRWGEKVFETSDIRKGWNGIYKGETLPGTYVYIVSYHSDCDTITKMLKGSLILIR